MGRSGLARALQGAGSSKLTPGRFAAFGALRGWTQKAIRDLVDDVEEQGMLESYQKGAYRLVRLTDSGKSRIVSRPETAVSEPPLSPRKSPQIVEEEYDPAIFERLRAWQLSTAKERDIAPFLVLPLSTLKRIAATRPSSLKELRAVKGVGPITIEKWGSAVLAIVTSPESDQTAARIEGE
jgi:superfamily II DNA helicase RecQ